MGFEWLVSSMTTPRYLTDSSVRQFEATVERVLENRLVLDQTHFYPEGGGQPADTGWLERAATDADDTTTDADDTTREWRVTDVQKRDTIYHHLETAPELKPPRVGETVTCRLDWDRRYGHMRTHTAQHLLSAHLLEAYNAPTTGNQVYADRARLDCAVDRFHEDDLEAIEATLNATIDDDLPVRWYELERDVAEERLDLERTRIDLLPASITEIRIVEIGDEAEPLDRVACAGTHVESTGEIGELEITGRETAGSGQERLRFRLVS